MQDRGVASTASQIDWQALMRFKRTFTDPVPGNQERGYAKAGIKTFHGRTRFLDQSTLQVEDDMLDGRFVLLAARERTATRHIPGEEQWIQSDSFYYTDHITLCTATASVGCYKS